MRLSLPSRIEDLIVNDGFAGGGGTSQGAKEAGMQVAWAGNDWPLAVEVHSRKHPEVEHVCQDLQRIDWRTVPNCHIFWFSPTCQGFGEPAQPARARDESVRIHHDALRMSAWVVVDGVRAKRPWVFCVENVVPFLWWEFLPEWRSCLEKMGYKITIQRLTASHWGVPQDRERVIIVGRLEAPLAIVEPLVLHDAKPGIGTVLDFDSGDWTSIRSMKKPGARERARHANNLFSGRPCWGQHVSHRGAWGRPLHQPSTTVTTQNQHYVVQDGAYRLWTVEETSAAMGFPRDYFEGVGRTAALVMAGNAVPPAMAAAVLRQVGESLLC